MCWRDNRRFIWYELARINPIHNLSSATLILRNIILLSVALIPLYPLTFNLGNSIEQHTVIRGLEEIAELLGQPPQYVVIKDQTQAPRGRHLMFPGVTSSKNRGSWYAILFFLRLT